MMCWARTSPRSVYPAGRSSASPQVHETRGLYDGAGELLLALPDERSVEATVFGLEYTFRVGDGGERLTVTRWVQSDDRDEQCRALSASRASEVESRRKDVAGLESDAKKKQAEIASNFMDEEVRDDLLKELGQILTVMGNHQLRVKELTESAGVKVSYEQRRKGKSVVLQEGAFSLVGFFGRPVAFLSRRLQPLAVAEEREEVSALEASLSAWQGEQIDGTFVETIGAGQGSDPGQLDIPAGVAVNGDLVYVADGGNHRVCVFGRDKVFQRVIGSGKGSGDGELKGPRDIALHGDRVYVADTNNNRVSVFHTDGSFEYHIGGGKGSAEGQMDWPVGVVVADGKVFVSERGNFRLSVFSLGGVFSHCIGSGRGSEPGQLETVVRSAVSDGLVFVSDHANDRVSVFRVNGSFVRVFGEEGDEDGQFFGPTGVAVVGELVFVADTSNNRVSVHRLDGKFVRSFTHDRLKLPYGLAVVGDRLFVTDFDNHCVHVFA
jgi:hypothetical protein